MEVSYTQVTNHLSAGNIKTFLLEGFVSEEALTELLKELRGRVRTKMTRQGKRKFRKETNSEAVAGSQPDNLVLLHSGILGLCSFVEGRKSFSLIQL